MRVSDGTERVGHNPHQSHANRKGGLVLSRSIQAPRPHGVPRPWPLALTRATPLRPVLMHQRLLAFPPLPCLIFTVRTCRLHHASQPGAEHSMRPCDLARVPAFKTIAGSAWQACRRGRRPQRRCIRARSRLTSFWESHAEGRAVCPDGSPMIRIPSAA
jgi:hypothetical protein